MQRQIRRRICPSRSPDGQPTGSRVDGCQGSHPANGVECLPNVATEADMPTKVIGIDLGTTNSCVAVMEGRQAEGDRKRRRSADDALDGRVRQGRRGPGRPAGQAPGRDQPGKHNFRDQAPDRPPLRRSRSSRRTRASCPTRSCAATMATPGSRPTARNTRPRRSPPSSCRR